MKQKSVGKLFFQASLLLVLLFGLVWIIVMESDHFLGLELAALLVLLLLSAAGLITYKNNGENILFIVFALYSTNILILGYYFNHQIYLVLLLLSLIGFWVSIPRRAGESGSCETSCEPAKVPSPPPQKVVDGQVVEAKSESKEKAAPATAKFTPGKYVASKRSNVYHEPKCDWAKKIQKERQLWFAEKKDALNKGYRKHDCVK